MMNEIHFTVYWTFMNYYHCIINASFWTTLMPDSNKEKRITSVICLGINDCVCCHSYNMNRLFEYLSINFWSNSVLGIL